MIDLSALLSKMGEIAIFIVIGAAGRGLGVFSEESNRALSKLIVLICIPALLLATVMKAEPGMGAGEIAAFLGVATLWELLLLGAALLLARLFAPPGSERGTYAFVMAFGNLGIFGFAVVQPLFGAAGLLKALFMNIPFNCIAYSLGVILIQGGRRPGQRVWKLMLNPAFFISALSPLLYLLDIPWPAPLVSAASAIGAAAMPLLMFTVGATLVTIRPREFAAMPRVLAVSAVRMLVMPVLVWLVFRLFVRDAVSLGVITVLTATPTAGMVTAMNILYGDHEKEASLATFVTTLLSLGTIPLLVRLLLT